jgi:preprotein translocase subunit SecY
MLDAMSLSDLRGKIIFTLAMLVVFRFIAHVPLPGVDLAGVRELFAKNQILGMLDLFSGGAMKNFSIAAMGVYPYITAVIVMQLLTPVIPQLQALAREGEAGRNKINQYTHWLTVPMAALQGYGQLVLLQHEGVITGVGLSGANLLPTAAMIICMTAGTMFLVWLGELIDQRGIGNGVSIIIFAGIVAGLPDMVGRGFITGGVNTGGLVTFIVLALATLVFIVVFTEAHRRVPVQYARSMVRGGRMYRQSGSTHIPIPVNSAGMIPLIFAMALMVFPATIASYFVHSSTFGGAAEWVIKYLGISSPIYWGLYFLLVVGFTFFYTMVLFQQQNLAEVLQKQGGFIPGVRPGQTTENYLSGVTTRLTWAGAIFLALVAIMPFFTQTAAPTMMLSSAGLLIVVGVALNTMKQLEAQLLMRRYEGFIK